MIGQIFYYSYYLNKIRILLRRSPEEIEKYQLQKAVLLMHHAYYRVPYYRTLFDQAGITPSDIKSKFDFFKLPLTTKEKLRQLPLEARIVKGTDIRKLKNMSTSGSTGIPLRIFSSEREVLKSKTLPFLNIFLENGCLLIDKTLRLTHPCHVMKPYWFQRLNILPEYFVTVDTDMDEQLTRFMEIKPQAIRGYSSAIKSLALKIKEKSSKFISPKVIFTTAEVLSERDRKIISSFFQAEVIDYYCCNEFGIIAWECRRHKGYHINSDNVMVEFLKDGRAAEEGEECDLVITSLNNYIMPFIRYKIGDKGILKKKPCGCGNNSLLLEAIRGRSDDIVVLSDGKMLSPYLLTSLFKDIPGVIEFQVIQKEQGRFDVPLVKEDTVADNLLIKTVQKQCQGLLGDAAQIRPFIVRHIPKEKSGKFKVIINEMRGVRSHLS